MHVFLAKPRGFCAGVDRAVDIVDYALKLHGPPLYVKHEIVHNRYVVEDFRKRGVVFIEDPEEVPEGAVIIFSAHGISPAVREAAARRRLKVIDATCPLVTKVHLEAFRFASKGYFIILVGHLGHPEVEGTMGEVPGHIQLVQTVEEAEQVQVPDPERVAYLTQTTLSLEDTAEIVAVLKRRFPRIQGPPSKDICYATQNRQNAVKRLATMVDLVLVVGAPNSSNSNRLREVAEKAGVKAYLLESAEEIDPNWFLRVERVGLTAGASAPEVLVQQILEALRGLGATAVEEVEVVDERVNFPLPKELVLEAQHSEGGVAALEALRRRWYPQETLEI